MLATPWWGGKWGPHKEKSIWRCSLSREKWLHCKIIRVLFRVYNSCGHTNPTIPTWDTDSYSNKMCSPPWPWKMLREVSRGKTSHYIPNPAGAQCPWPVWVTEVIIEMDWCNRSIMDRCPVWLLWVTAWPKHTLYIIPHTSRAPSVSARVHACMRAYVRVDVTLNWAHLKINCLKLDVWMVNYLDERFIEIILNRVWKMFKQVTHMRYRVVRKNNCHHFFNWVRIFEGYKRKREGKVQYTVCS